MKWDEEFLEKRECRGVKTIHSYVYRNAGKKALSLILG